MAITEKRIQRIIEKEVDKHYTPEQQDFIEWATDIETDTHRICRGSFKSKSFKLMIDLKAGTAQWLWQGK